MESSMKSHHIDYCFAQPVKQSLSALAYQTVDLDHNSSPMFPDEGLRKKLVMQQLACDKEIKFLTNLYSTGTYLQNFNRLLLCLPNTVFPVNSFPNMSFFFRSFFYLNAIPIQTSCSLLKLFFFFFEKKVYLFVK